MQDFAFPRMPTAGGYEKAFCVDASDMRMAKGRSVVVLISVLLDELGFDGNSHELAAKIHR